MVHKSCPLIGVQLLSLEWCQKCPEVKGDVQQNYRANMTQILSQYHLLAQRLLHENKIGSRSVIIICLLRCPGEAPCSQVRRGGFMCIKGDSGGVSGENNLISGKFVSSYSKDKRAVCYRKREPVWAHTSYQQNWTELHCGLWATLSLLWIILQKQFCLPIMWHNKGLKLSRINWEKTTEKKTIWLPEWVFMWRPIKTVSIYSDVTVSSS